MRVGENSTFGHWNQRNRFRLIVHASVHSDDVRRTSKRGKNKNVSYEPQAWPIFLVPFDVVCANSFFYFHFLGLVPDQSKRKIDIIHYIKCDDIKGHLLANMHLAAHEIVEIKIGETQ